MALRAEGADHRRASFEGLLRKPPQDDEGLGTP
jgi:hypothetical protein